MSPTRKYLLPATAETPASGIRRLARRAISCHASRRTGSAILGILRIISTVQRQVWKHGFMTAGLGRRRSDWLEARIVARHGLHPVQHVTLSLSLVDGKNYDTTDGSLYISETYHTLLSPSGEELLISGGENGICLPFMSQYTLVCVLTQACG